MRVETKRHRCWEEATTGVAPALDLCSLLALVLETDCVLSHGLLFAVNVDVSLIHESVVSSI